MRHCWFDHRQLSKRGLHKQWLDIRQHNCSRVAPAGLHETCSAITESDVAGSNVPGLNITKKSATNYAETVFETWSYHLRSLKFGLLNTRSIGIKSTTIADIIWQSWFSHLTSYWNVVHHQWRRCPPSLCTLELHLYRCTMTDNWRDADQPWRCCSCNFTGSPI